jgi:hypothetical protein
MRYGCVVLNSGKAPLAPACAEDIGKNNKPRTKDKTAPIRGFFWHFDNGII